MMSRRRAAKTGCSSARGPPEKRLAAITSLIQSATLNGLDLYAYLKDVLDRLPTQRASAIDQFLPHRWSSRS
jgi:transposase